MGFLDDFIKIVKQRSLGLRSAAKMIGQTVIALVFGILALSPMLEDENHRAPASHHISFIKDIGWELPAVLVLVLIWFLVAGFSNAVNLTDGLDGLATGACTMVFGAYTLVNIWQNNQSCASLPSVNCYEVRDPLDLAIVSAAITGRLLRLPVVERVPRGDLHGRHRLPRARRGPGRAGDPDPHRGAAADPRRAVRRRDALGDAAGRLLQAQQGQTASSGSRRIHHHFEMVGWEEVTVVIRFWIITGLCVATGLGVFYAQWVASA